MKATAILLLLLVIVACAPAAPPQAQQLASERREPQAEPQQTQRTPVTPQTKEFTLELKQFSFTPDTITVKKGDKVRLTLKSKDVTHGLSLPDYNVNSGPIAKDETKVVEFVADRAGAFTFKCSVVCGVGHKEMKGTLIVQE